MAATELLAVGTTAASSGDVVVAVGDQVTIALKGAENGAKVNIELRDDAGAYLELGTLLGSGMSDRLIVITAPGTYRFTRVAGNACGVFRA